MYIGCNVATFVTRQTTSKVSVSAACTLAQTRRTKMHFLKYYICDDDHEDDYILGWLSSSRGHLSSTAVRWAALGDFVPVGPFGPFVRWSVSRFDWMTM